jgi:hypothetical protein
VFSSTGLKLKALTVNISVFRILHAIYNLCYCVVLAFTGTPVVSKLYLMIHVSEKLNREPKVKLRDPVLFRCGVTTTELDKFVENKTNNKSHPLKLRW